MKLETHYIFTIGILAVVTRLLDPTLNLVIYLTIAISVIVNLVIDKAGHKEIMTHHGVIPVRTPLTHTFPRSAIWGIVLSAPVAMLVYLAVIHGLIYGDGTTAIRLASIIVMEGAVAGLSHMFLDMFTEKGVYVKKDGKWVRFAVAHFRYNDPFVNSVASVVGVLLLLWALGH